MLLKLIDCRVRSRLRHSFSRAQREWRPVVAAPGFLFQTGGWCESDPGRALILAGWSDRAAHERFLCGLHDEILRSSRQGDTIDSCRTAFYTRAGPEGGRAEDVLLAERLIAASRLVIELTPASREATDGAAVLLLARSAEDPVQSLTVSSAGVADASALACRVEPEWRLIAN